MFKLIIIGITVLMFTSVSNAQLRSKTWERKDGRDRQSYLSQKLYEIQRGIHSAYRNYQRKDGMMSDQYRNLKRTEKDEIIESRKNPRSDQRKKLYKGGAVTFDTFEDLKRYGTKEDKEAYVRKQKGLTAFEIWKMMDDLGLFDKKKPVPKM